MSNIYCYAHQYFDEELDSLVTKTWSSLDETKTHTLVHEKVSPLTSFMPAGEDRVGLVINQIEEDESFAFGSATYNEEDFEFYVVPFDSKRSLIVPFTSISLSFGEPVIGYPAIGWCSPDRQHISISKPDFLKFCRSFDKE